MKYADSVYAPADHLVADIYRIEKSNFYIIRFFEISDNGTKYLGKRLKARLDNGGLQSIKDEIKEKRFQEVFQNKKNTEKLNFINRIAGIEKQI